MVGFHLSIKYSLIVFSEPFRYETAAASIVGATNSGTDVDANAINTSLRSNWFSISHSSCFQSVFATVANKSNSKQKHY